MQKKIVIAATQRSGSTLICEDFTRTGLLGCPEEYFIPWVSAPNDKFNWGLIFNNMKRNKSHDDVFAVKVMADQVPYVDEKLATLPVFEKTKDHPCKSFYKAFSDATWVYLKRNDYLKQAISRVIARQTGICHAVDDDNKDFFPGQLMIGYDDNYNSNVQFSYCKIMSEINSIQKENFFWESFFNRYNINPVMINYESDTSDTEYLLQILEAAEIEYDKDEILDIAKKRKIKKLSNSKNKEWEKSVLEMQEIEQSL